MEAIAQRAKVSKGTLYARYNGKEPLLHAVVEDEFARWSKRAGENDHLLPEELGPRLRHHANVLIEAYAWPEYQRMARLIDGALATIPSLAHVWREMGTSRYVQFLATDMATAAPGVSADWGFLARLFLFSISGWQRDAHFAGGADDEVLHAFADQVVSTIELAVREAERTGSAARQV